MTRITYPDYLPGWPLVAVALSVVSPAQASPPLASAAPMATSDSNGAWTEESETGYPDLADWMANVPDDVLLSELSIPGTHDSGSYAPASRSLGTWAKTQSMDIHTQLMAGVRSLDLRLMGRWGRCFIGHGPVRMNVTCYEALNQVRTFLSEHQSETVLVSLKKNSVDPAGTDDIEALVASFSDIVWVSDEEQPGERVATGIPLGATRGTMILLAPGLDLDAGLGLATKAVDDCATPDWDGETSEWETEQGILVCSEWRWEVSQYWLPALWNSKRVFIEGADARLSKAPHVFSWTTITAASTNVTPYYAATGRHRFWTTVSSDCEPNVCEFAGLNELAMHYLNGLGSQHVGVVVSDFPGGGLIRAIIGANEFVAAPGSAMRRRTSEGRRGTRTCGNQLCARRALDLPGSDRQRAVDMAEPAKRDYAAAGPGFDGERRKIADWLRQR